MTTTTLWRARCKHRDVRIYDEACPAWSPCLFVGCSAAWARYEVTETVAFEIRVRKAAPGQVAWSTHQTMDEALEAIDSIQFEWKRDLKIVEVTKRTLRKASR